MALSSAERQQRYRSKLKTGELSRIDAKLPRETVLKLDYLAEYWECTKTEALSRCLSEAWERAGQPVPFDEAQDAALPVESLSLDLGDLVLLDPYGIPPERPKPTEDTVYQIRLTLLGVTPSVWRRLLITADTTIAQLHDIVQAAMGWEDFHLHRFVINNGEYGISQMGGISFQDEPSTVLLRDFNLRPGDVFYYEYDFGDNWEHELYIEDMTVKAPSATTGSSGARPARTATYSPAGDPSTRATLRSE